MNQDINCNEVANTKNKEVEHSKKLKIMQNIVNTFSFTFSNDDGLTTEKQTKKTSVCG